MTIGHYLKSMPQLTNQFTPASYRDHKRQRLYLKDIDCPVEWARNLEDLLPATFFYLNECIEARSGGDGAILEPNEYGQMKYGKGVAPAGDLMSSLPPEMRALNMMCYIGHEGTYTPAHREMCASLGQNIMIEASEDGNGEKAGSSIWFMTETKEREVVSEYFLSMLGHDIEVENHFAQINAWKKAPFNVWVVEQRPGDLILIPPLAPHQVWNRGTRTMKAAWNRTTVDTLELALHEALPRARLVCRDEQYKNKAIVYYTLIKYRELLQRDTIEPKMWRYGRIKQLLEDFKRLFALYTEILVSEMFASTLPTEQNIEFLQYDSNVTCSYCRCNIFNRFLTCKTCIETGPNGEEDTYDICMECYAMGRSCGCISNLKWVEQWEWSALTGKYEEWRNVIVQCDGFFDVQKSPQPLDVARKRYGRKPVAHICQEQLKIRPWHDILKPFVPEPSPGASDVEPEADDSGRPKKKTPRKSRNGRVTPAKNKTCACHVCCHHDWKWRLAFCTTCSNAYCYGVLWRAFDLMPQAVMEDRDWSCPKCQGICSCGKCRKNPKQKPYAPKGTLLGHDTRKVADFRSVESLVDFSKTNLGWLRGENDHNPHESERMKRLKEKAEEAKAREDVIGENYFDNDIEHITKGDEQFEQDGHIDPLLRNPTVTFISSNGDFRYESPYAPMNPPAVDGGEGTFTAPQAVMCQDVDETHLNSFDLSSRPGVRYPSALLGSPAPTRGLENSEQLERKLEHLDQNRMMGVGFYKQGNGVDKILYDPPDLGGTMDESQSIPFTTTANFAFSDILQPSSQIEAPKKRRHGFTSGGEDDKEFFTSKRQKKLAEAKRPKGTQNGEQLNQRPHSTTPSQRPPRVGAVKLQTYLDLGEDAEPISDSEIIEVKPRNPKSKHQGKSDGEGIIRVSHRLRRKPSTEHIANRRNTRGHESCTTASSTTAKPANRKSAWLSRKKAQEDGTGSPPAPSKRRGRPRTRLGDLVQLDASPNDNEDEDDSLFGNDDNDMETIADSAKKHSIQKKTSKPAPRLHVSQWEAESEGNEKGDKPIPRPRGRPRKSDPSPMKPSGPTQLLSLKEKLALKGKIGKIVSSKKRALSGMSWVLTKAGSTMTTGKTFQMNTASISPSAKDAAAITESNFSNPLATAKVFAGATSVHLLNGYAQADVPPIKKGPTVVRLSSPSNHFDKIEEAESGFAGSS